MGLGLDTSDERLRLGQRARKADTRAALLGLRLRLGLGLGLGLGLRSGLTLTLTPTLNLALTLTLTLTPTCPRRGLSTTRIGSGSALRKLAASCEMSALDC